MKALPLITLFFLFIAFTGFSQNKLNVVILGAHPDDCDVDAGGCAILWAKAGFNVMFVSLTNGGAGHQEKGGGALAKMRRAEATGAGKRYGGK